MIESCVSVRRKAEVWKDYMERIMNDKNDLDHVEGDAEEGPIVCVSREFIGVT